jgi:FMN phosphatase YigB (HAD superfamily)
MKDIPSIFFVVGGVFLPRIYFAAIQMLEDSGQTVSDKDRIRIRQLENDLLTATKNEDEFFASLSSLHTIPDPLTRKDFLDQFCIDPDLLHLVKELGFRKEVVLFCDYPKPWLSEFDRDGPTAGLFSRVVYLEELGCSNIHAAIFDRLVLDHQVTAGGCLWVDSDTLRTSLCLRRGIDAIIYVNPYLLRRELQLRSIL